MCTLRFALVCLVLASLSTVATGEVLITEIMYNPDSSEGRPGDRNNPDDPGEPCLVEWVEVYNAGDQSADLSGWRLSDEDGRTTGLPDGTVLDPGEALVMIPGEQSISGFRAAWGEGYDVYPVSGWAWADGEGLSNLSNSPGDTNEMLQLRDADDNMIDEVNFDDEGDWPSDSPDGPSIFLLPGMIDTQSNNDGLNWQRSIDGRFGAFACEETGDYKPSDIGSPGVVVTEDE